MAAGCDRSFGAARLQPGEETRPAWRRRDRQQRRRNKDGLQAFLQAFPNLSCFCPSFSKESFGGFVGFQGVTRPPNHKGPSPNFFVAPASFRPRSRRRRAALRLRGADGGSLRVGGEDGRVHGGGVFPDWKNYEPSTNSGFRKLISVISAIMDFVQA